IIFSFSLLTIPLVQEDFIAFEETSYEENYIWNINAEFGNYIICKYGTKMSKPKSNVVQTTQINNQSYVNCQGTPAAKMQPGIFISMSKI
ncbi:MAG: hypothetical protein ACLSG4_18705, partial [Anaerobutyricum sp.]